MASRVLFQERPRPALLSAPLSRPLPLVAPGPPPPATLAPFSRAGEGMGSSASPSPPPPPMIGRAGNLTVFITPLSPASTPRGSARAASESPRPGFSTPTPCREAAPSPAASLSPSPKMPPAAPVVFTPPPPPVKFAPPPVQVPPPQYEKAGKHDGSAFGFFWNAVARVQEVHASLDEYVANWFGLDQSKYQWALNDYYEATGKEVDFVKPGKPKDVTAKVQKV